MKLREKLSWALVATLGLFVIAALAGIVSGGPLDPSGPPASTRKPLDDVLSSWNQRLPANDGATPCESSRFQCIFPDGVDGSAVLDRETGLVWDLVAQPLNAWVGVQASCFLSSNGGRRGWRLPTIEELSSLMEPSVGDPPFLPAGHPFLLVHPTDPYYTASSLDNGLGRLAFFNQGLGEFDKTDPEFKARYMCVRGGTGHDG